MKETDGSFDYAVKILDGAMVSRLEELPLLSLSSYEYMGATVETRGVYGIPYANETLSYRREESNGNVAHMISRRSEVGERREIFIVNNALVSSSGYKNGLGKLDAQGEIAAFVSNMSEAIQQDK